MLEHELNTLTPHLIRVTSVLANIQLLLVFFVDSNLRGESSYAGIIEKTSFRELDKFISRSLKFQYQTSFEMTVFSVVLFLISLDARVSTP